MKIPKILTKFVREECSSFAQGRCLGVDAYGQCFRPESECSVLDMNRCEYFSDVVLKTLGGGLKFKEAKRAYCEVWYWNARGRDVKRCKCDAVLSPRRRLCDSCRDENRKKTYRNSKRRRRGKKRGRFPLFEKGSQGSRSGPDRGLDARIQRHQGETRPKSGKCRKAPSSVDVITDASESKPSFELKVIFDDEEDYRFVNRVLNIMERGTKTSSNGRLFGMLASAYLDQHHCDDEGGLAVELEDQIRALEQMYGVELAVKAPK